MEDDEDDDPLWWQSPVTYEQLKARMEETRRRVEKETREQHANWELQQAKWEEYGYNSAKRSWAIWRRRKDGLTLKQVGDEFGLNAERVRQIVAKYDRKIRDILNPGINMVWENVSDEVREATLGVEFTFRNELTFVGWNGDMRGWDQLEPTQRSPHYPAWMLESGQIDEKPRPIYTYYQIAKKEQTND